MVWYIEERDLDLLDLPDEVRFGQDDTEKPFLVERALTCGDLEIALTVIGYKNARERNELSKVLRPRCEVQAGLSTSVADPDVRSVTEAVETTICFWRRPDTHDRSDAEVEGNHDFAGAYGPGGKPKFEPSWGPNIGLELGPGAVSFGANITNTKSGEESAQGAAWRSGSRTDEQTAKPRKSSRKDWLSHQDVGRQVAIFYGGRDAGVPSQHVGPRGEDPPSVQYDVKLSPEVREALSHAVRQGAGHAGAAIGNAVGQAIFRKAVIDSATSLAADSLVMIAKWWLG